MSETLAPENLSAIFKAYDVRGLVGEQLDETLAQRIGAAFVEVTGASTVVVGYDMRSSSPGMAGAFADGAAGAGADVVLIGLASTDQLYFASGHLGHPGAMFTASHNPAAYNGIKMCRAGAAPIGMETGLAEIRDAVASGRTPTATRVGSISNHDVLEAYAAHLLSLAPVKGRRLKVVADAGNGMAGLTAPAVFERVGTTRSSWCRCSSSSTAPSPTTRPTRSSRTTWSTCRSGCWPRTPTSAWPSTATPTAASSLTSEDTR